MNWIAENWDQIITVLNMIGLLIVGKRKSGA